MYDQIAANKLRSAALIVVFILLFALVGYVFGQATEWGYAGLAIALVVAFVMTWGSYWYSDKIVLSISRARPVDRTVEPYLVNTIEGLAIAAGLPVPRAYVIDDPAPNAFATGRDPEHAAIAVRVFPEPVAMARIPRPPLAIQASTARPWWAPSRAAPTACSPWARPCSGRVC